MFKFNAFLFEVDDDLVDLKLQFSYLKLCSTGDNLGVVALSDLSQYKGFKVRGYCNNNLPSNIFNVDKKGARGLTNP